MKPTRPTWLRGLLLALPLAGYGCIAVAADAYAVSATLSPGGQVLATPVLLVKPHVAANIRTDGPGGYAARFSVSPAEEGLLQVVASVKTARGGMAPTLLIKPGEPAFVSMGDLAMRVTVVPDDGTLQRAMRAADASLQ